MINKRDELLRRRLQLTPEKQALLQKRLRGEAPENSKDTIPRRPAQESVPLSFAQEQLWLLEQLAPKTGAYNIAEAVKLGGKLNIQVLEQAINEIIRRHEILRTTFTYTWQPIQVIAAELSISLSVIDISTLDREKQEKAFKSLSTKEAQYPFDFALGPLLRATLLKLGAEEHLFLLTVPHIIADGWSQHVFIRELTVLYDAFSLAKRSPLPELPLQYADFAYWQRQYLQGEKLERELNYWKRQLAAAPITEIFPDRPRATIQSFSGAEVSFDLPASLHEPLTLLCQRENITLFMFFLAAFNILLAYYTRMEDIVVGTPITNLHHAELESLIGDFINTLVLRTDLSGNPSFREVLSRVRKISVEAYAHKQVPFGLLVEELYIKRDVSRNPLFQIMFVSHDAPKIPLEMPSLTVRAMEIEKKRSIFDLTLQMEGQRGWFGYNTDLFDATTIRKMADHFLTLLEAVIANPEKRISDLLIFTQDDGQQILIGRNDPERKHVQNL
ncbi:MAG TPA: condensation domain-containing protein, partial [Ktedonobacteraceae bacterium]|nr:condensation domain-containing protein [Ktedonobacteraceae bacterium]